MRVAYRHFDFSIGCFVFEPVSLAFQKISLGIFRSFFIIGGMDCSCLRLRGVFAKIFRRICADRGWVGCLADNIMEYQIISSLSRTNAFYNMFLPSLFGDMDLHRTKLEQFSRSAVIQKTSKKDTQTASFFHQ